MTSVNLRIRRRKGLGEMEMTWNWIEWNQLEQFARLNHACQTAIKAANSVVELGTDTTFTHWSADACWASMDGWMNRWLDAQLRCTHLSGYHWLGGRLLGCFMTKYRLNAQLLMQQLLKDACQIEFVSHLDARLYFVPFSHSSANYHTCNSNGNETPMLVSFINNISEIRINNEINRFIWFDREREI